MLGAACAQSAKSQTLDRILKADIYYERPLSPAYYSE